MGHVARSPHAPRLFEAARRCISAAWSVANFGIQEYTAHTADSRAVFPHAWSLHDGYLRCGETPGHGVEIDGAAASRFPYARSYLDVARLRDGSLWSWRRRARPPRHGSRFAFRDFTEP